MADSTDEPTKPQRAQLQGRRGIAVIAAGIIVFVLLAVGIISAVLASGIGSTFSGCTVAEMGPIPKLRALGILRAAPEGATFRELRSGCDSDDRIAWAEAAYSFDGPRETAVAFYRDAAVADGWRLRSEDKDPSEDPTERPVDVSSLCFAKELEGFTAYLSLTFQRAVPADLPSTNAYWWGARANAERC